MNQYKRDKNLLTFGTAQKQTQVWYQWKREKEQIDRGQGENDKLRINNYQKLTEQIQEKTIIFQKQILNSFDTLQDKIKQLQQQKQKYKIMYEEQLGEVQRIRNNLDHNSNSIKKVKQLGQSLKRMQNKVTGEKGSVLDASDWIMNIVKQYQQIKTNSLKWKQAYTFLYGQDHN